MSAVTINNDGHQGKYKVLPLWDKRLFSFERQSIFNRMEPKEMKARIIMISEPKKGGKVKIFNTTKIPRAENNNLRIVISGFQDYSTS